MLEAECLLPEDVRSGRNVPVIADLTSTGLISGLSLVFRLVREWYVRDGLEDDLAVGVDRGWEGLGRAVDRDGRGAQGA